MTTVTPSMRFDKEKWELLRQHAVIKGYRGGGTIVKKLVDRYLEYGDIESAVEEITREINTPKPGEKTTKAEIEKMMKNLAGMAQVIRESDEGLSAFKRGASYHKKTLKNELPHQQEEAEPMAAIVIGRDHLIREKMIPQMWKIAHKIWELYPEAKTEYEEWKRENFPDMPAFTPEEAVSI